MKVVCFGHNPVPDGEFDRDVDHRTRLWGQDQSSGSDTRCRRCWTCQLKDIRRYLRVTKTVTHSTVGLEELNEISPVAGTNVSVTGFLETVLEGLGGCVVPSWTRPTVKLSDL